MKLEKLVLETERLVLRPVRISDAQEIFEKINHKEIVRLMFGPPYPYKLKDAFSFIKTARNGYKNGSSCDLAITLKETGEYIGGIGINRISDINKNANLGYWISSEHQGKGYATEAAKRMIEFGFNKLKLVKLYAAAVSANPGSLGVLEKAGFKKEGLRRKHAKDPFVNKWYDDVEFGLLKEEWKK